MRTLVSNLWSATDSERACKHDGKWEQPVATAHVKSTSLSLSFFRSLKHWWAPAVAVVINSRVQECWCTQSLCGSSLSWFLWRVSLSTVNPLAHYHTESHTVFLMLWSHVICSKSPVHYFPEALTLNTRPSECFSARKMCLNAFLFCYHDKVWCI